MSIYKELNTIIRTKVNSSILTYQDATLQHFFPGESSSDLTAYSTISTYTSNPTPTTVGEQAPVDMLGYIQYLVKLPVTDTGIDWAINDIASQIETFYPQKAEVIGKIKLEIQSVERMTPLVVDGSLSVTVRVHFRAFACK